MKQPGQEAVKYRWNVGSLSINMSADNRTTTLGPHINQHISWVSVDLSTDARLICWSICPLTHLSWPINRHPTNISVNICRYVDMSVESRSICRPIYRLRGAQNTHDPISLSKPAIKFSNLAISWGKTSKISQAWSHMLQTNGRLV